MAHYIESFFLILFGAALVLLIGKIYYRNKKVISMVAKNCTECPFYSQLGIQHFCKLSQFNKVQATNKTPEALKENCPIEGELEVVIKEHK